MRQEFENLATSVANDIDDKEKEIADLLQNKKTLSKGDKDYILSAFKYDSQKQTLSMINGNYMELGMKMQ